MHNRKELLPRINPDLLMSFCLIVAGCLVYSGMFSHGFIFYDDYQIIVNRISTYDGLNVENLKNIFIKDFPREEPLLIRDVSYLLNASIFGPLNPRGYLFGNFLLHIFVSYLVYIFCLHLVPGKHLLAGVAAVFFVLHPIHVESIAWISSRKDPLYVFFYLLSFCTYIHFLKRKYRTYLLFSFFFFIMALFSKSAAISFFPAIFCYRLILARHVALKKEELLFLAALVFATVLYSYWYIGVLQEFGVLTDQLAKRNWPLWFLNNTESLTFYIGKLFYPAKLSPMYDFPSPTFLFVNIVYLSVSLLIVGGVSFLMIYLWNRNHSLSLFLLLLFFCSLLPYLDFARVNIFVADRYLYLASIPFCIFLSLLVFRLLRRFKTNRFATVFICVIIGVYGSFYAVTTVRVVSIWESTERFWKHVNIISPNRVEPYTGLMEDHLRSYHYNMRDSSLIPVLHEIEKIGLVALNRFCQEPSGCPREVIPVVTVLAQTAWQLEESKKAEYYYQLALKLDPEFSAARYRYIIFLIKERRLDEAKKQIDEVEKHVHPYLDSYITKDIKYRLRPMLQKLVLEEESINDR